MYILLIYEHIVLFYITYSRVAIYKHNNNNNFTLNNSTIVIVEHVWMTYLFRDKNIKTITARGERLRDFYFRVMRISARAP